VGRERLLEVLPPDAAVVLELGCGTGELGRALKRLNPLARYLGVERDRTAAQAATRHLDAVLVGTAERLTAERLARGLGTPELRVDCLIYGGLLPRLEGDPAQTLARQAGWLGEDGLVVASLEAAEPAGSPAGGTSGLTLVAPDAPLPAALAPLLDLIARAGLTVLDLRRRTLAARRADPLGGALREALVADPAADTAGELAQWVVRARRNPEPPRRMLIQTATLKPQAGMIEVRVGIPDRFARTLPGVRVVAAPETADLDLPTAPGESRVFVWQRPILKFPDHIPNLRAVIRRGYLLVVERDDYPFRPEYAENRYLSFRGAHAVQTSTEALAEVLRQWNPNVAVFPNQLATLPPPRRYDDQAPVTVFFGALNRGEDWRPLIPALNAVLGERRGRVAVQVVHDREFFEALDCPDKRFEPTAPYARYLSLLRGCDVALLPLSDTLFNRCKSDIKFLECSAHGVAVLASPVVYGASVLDGETGLLFRDEEEFADRLGRLLDDRTLRRGLAARAYGHVRRNRMMAQHFRRRIDWYRELLDRLPALNAELRERVPEIWGG
jgi:glycosyltransferase involved in cell wall biosynthesis